MERVSKSIKIGSVELSPKELEILRTYRDYKKLREIAGLHSSLKSKKRSMLKDVLEIDSAKNDSEQTERPSRPYQKWFPSRYDSGAYKVQAQVHPLNSYAFTSSMSVY